MILIKGDISYNIEQINNVTVINVVNPKDSNLYLVSCRIEDSALEYDKLSEILEDISTLIDTINR